MAINQEELESRKKKLTDECLCGCGEQLPQMNIRRNYYFINKNHEKLYRKRQLIQEREEQNKKRNVESITYCKAYKENEIFCIRCCSQGDGMYRGCYVKPTVQKNKNEV